MFTTINDVQEFALTFVNKLVDCDVEDLLIEHCVEKLKQDDCIIPGKSEEFEITDYCAFYGVAFISSGGIPLGMFTVFQDDDFEEFDEPRLYVSINHNVVYLDEHKIE
jgi:hypothetical protein